MQQISTNKEHMKISDCVFREYDIRGIIGTEIPVEETYGLAHAIAKLFIQKNPATKTIAVGMDGRTHSPLIKEQVCRALVDAGFDVKFLGTCTTPALYFCLHTTDAQAGIMITASHNPKEYNGFKICLGKESVSGKSIREIRKLYKANAHHTAQHKGSLSEAPIHASYITWLVEHFSHLKNLDVPVILDCGNGAAGSIIPDLVKAFNWQQTKILYADIDGNYPHHEADPTIEKNMKDLQKELAHGSYMFGLGFDGDADRVGAMTREGYLIPGDRLLALLARPIIQAHPGATVICDVTSSSALLQVINAWQGRCLMVPTGHANIKSAMHREHALIGGELSCHFTFADRYFGFDDGIYAALRLIEYIHTHQQSLTELVDLFPEVYSSPSIRIPCDCTHVPAMIETIKKHYQDKPDANLITIDGVRVTTPYGWGLIRASNTQPVISLRFESNTPQDLTAIKTEFASLLSPYFDRNTLVTYLGI
jgi:phosphomannomutase/phosphoglucomutase